VLPFVVGCSASGLDAKSSFACKAPDGVTCMSVTGVYATSRANALPGQQPAIPDRGAGTAPTPAPSQATGGEQATAASVLRGPAPASGAPLRSPPRVLRIWVAPYEDSDGDLRDQSHIYVTVDPGAWQIEHTRRTIRDRFAPIRAVAPAASADTARSIDGGAATIQPGQRQEPALPGSGSTRLGGQ
jgi:conjugal transfer pilus assembly protein TraV